MTFLNHHIYHRNVLNWPYLNVYFILYDNPWLLKKIWVLKHLILPQLVGCPNHLSKVGSLHRMTKEIFIRAKKTGIWINEEKVNHHKPLLASWLFSLMVFSSLQSEKTSWHLMYMQKSQESYAFLMKQLVILDNGGFVSLLLVTNEKLFSFRKCHFFSFVHEYLTFASREKEKS